jgi:hypothetical protein
LIRAAYFFTFQTAQHATHLRDLAALSLFPSF